MHSMTAFARTTVSCQWGNATWEIRSVNHRFLEPSFRLPENMRDLEIPLRAALKQHIERGRIECTLRYEPSLDQAFAYSETQVKALFKLIATLPKEIPLAPVDPLKVLAWPGVLGVSSVSVEKVYGELLSSFSQCVLQLKEMRMREGMSIGHALEQHLQVCKQEVERLTVQVPVVIEQLQQQVKNKLIDLSAGINSAPERLEQELVFLATRMDVAEELQRLREHLHEVERQLKQNAPVGRRLDFLMQELHRETNTLGSKLQDTKITGAVVELKVQIEQMREQIQNLE